MFQESPGVRCVRRFQKDEKGYPNLYRNTKTGIWYFRKYLTGKGETTTSLRTVNRALAIRELNQVQASWLGTKGKASRVTFDAVEREVLEMYQTKAKTTFENYEIFRRLYLLPFFTGYRIQDVGKAWGKYKAFQRTQNPTRKLAHDKRYLSVILSHAYEQELIDRVPPLDLDPQDRAVKIGREATNEEIEALFTAARKNKRRTRALLKLELELKCGMRPGEPGKLKWEYIDCETGLVTLPAEIIKTRYGRCYHLDLSLLRRLLEVRKDSPYVFPHRNDPSRPSTRSDKTFQRLKKEAGVSLRQHWLRHTHVTRAVRGGIAPVIVQKSVGMSDQVMKRVYLHANESDSKKLSTVVGETLTQ